MSDQQNEFIVNPETDASERFPKAGVGEKILAVTGVIDRGMKQKGRQFSVHMIVLKDLVPGGQDQGTEVWETLTLSSEAKWKLADYCKAAQYLQPFNANDAALLAKALSNRPFKGVLKSNEYRDRQSNQTKTNIKVDTVEAFHGNVEEGWVDVLARGKQRLAKVIADEADPEKQQRRQQRRSGGGGGDPMGGGGGQQQWPVDDEIPF